MSKHRIKEDRATPSGNISRDRADSRNRLRSDSSTYDYPSFSFAKFSEKGHGFDCMDKEFKALIRKLKTLGQLTWSQIDSIGRHSNGYEKIPISEIHENTDMFPGDKAIVFRYNGLKPVAGFREGNVFHIVYLDEDFRLYDHS